MWWTALDERRAGTNFQKLGRSNERSAFSSLTSLKKGTGEGDSLVFFSSFCPLLFSRWLSDFAGRWSLAG